MAAGTEERSLAPAVAGREMGDKDPCVLEQCSNEIHQAMNYIKTQTSRLRNHTDLLFGAEPQTEKGGEKAEIAEVQPKMDVLAQAIRDLHNATGELNLQIERLETRRLV